MPLALTFSFFFLPAGKIKLLAQTDQLKRWMKFITDDAQLGSALFFSEFVNNLTFVGSRHL